MIPQSPDDDAGLPGRFRFTDSVARWRCSHYGCRHTRTHTYDRLDAAVQEAEHHHGEAHHMVQLTVSYHYHLEPDPR